MKKSQLYCLLFLQILLLFATINNTVSANAQCLDDQREHLMHFKNSLNLYLGLSTKVVQWNSEVDCCSWRGVGCDESGRVTTLELDNERIIGAADNFISLSSLRFLENLNLAFNYLNSIIPKAIANLTNLEYLNLSSCSLAGQVPVELSGLRNLVSLDLSMNHLTGEIPSSLKGLSFLSFLNLSFNSLTGEIPTGLLQTFSIDSYFGNVGLCGFPLTVRCGNDSESSRKMNEINWMYVSASVGYIVGLWIFSMLLMFCESWRLILFYQLDRLLRKVLRIGPEWREPIRRL